MKFSILIALFLMVSCSQDKRYVKRATPTPTPPPSPPVVPVNYQPDLTSSPPSGPVFTPTENMTGTAHPDTAEVYFFSDSTCNTLLASGTPANLTAGIPIPLSEGNNDVYVQVRMNDGQIICYPTPVRTYTRDTTPPDASGAIVTVLTADRRQITNSALQITNYDDANNVYYYADNLCTTLIGQGSNFANIPVVFPPNARTEVYFILEDLVGNRSSCMGSATFYIHDNINPTFNLVMPSSSSVTSHIQDITLQGGLDDTSAFPAPVSLILHKNSNTCMDPSPPFGGVDVAPSFMGAGLNLTVDNLATTNYYGLITDAAGNETCVLMLNYTHTTGPIDEGQSQFSIAHDITTSNPLMANTVTFYPRDINGNIVPASDVGSVQIEVSDNRNLTVPAASQTYTLTETSAGSGEYTVDVSLPYHYDVDIAFGSVMPITNRDIGSVYVATNDPFCFTGARATATTYNYDGDGTTGTPHIICHAAQLKDIADNCNSTTQAACDKEYILRNDINLLDWYNQNGTSRATQEFILAADPAHPLTGGFHGGDYTIMGYEDTQSSGNIVGMFGHANNFALKNLVFSYSYNSPNALSATRVSGLFDKIEGQMEMSYLDIQGNATTSNTTTFSGVFYDGLNLDSGDFKKSVINIFAQDFKDAAGFGYQVSGNALTINVEEINFFVNLTQSASPTTTSVVGGLFGTSNTTDFSDIRGNTTITLQSTAASIVGGVVAHANNGTMQRVVVHGGAITENGTFGSAELGGIVGRGPVAIHNSFALANISTGGCTVKCGKLLGEPIWPITGAVYSNNYSSTQTTLSLGSGGMNASSIETDINTTSQPTYFYDPLNPPLDTFNFTSIWLSNLATNQYPGLRRN